jgi:hypothetical protein
MEIEKCHICGRELVPDEDVDGKWDGHTYKWNCDCLNKDLRLSIG